MPSASNADAEGMNRTNQRKSYRFFLRLLLVNATRRTYLVVCDIQRIYRLDMPAEIDI